MSYAISYRTFHLTIVGLRPPVRNPLFKRSTLTFCINPPIQTVFTLSISSRKFSTFLHSKTCASIWIDARKRLTVYGKPLCLENP